MIDHWFVETNNKLCMDNDLHKINILLDICITRYPYLLEKIAYLYNYIYVSNKTTKLINDTNELRFLLLFKLILKSLARSTRDRKCGSIP